MKEREQVKKRVAKEIGENKKVFYYRLFMIICFAVGALAILACIVPSDGTTEEETSFSLAETIAFAILHIIAGVVLLMLYLKQKKALESDEIKEKIDIETEEAYKRYLELTNELNIQKDTALDICVTSKKTANYLQKTQNAREKRIEKGEERIPFTIQGSITEVYSTYPFDTAIAIDTGNKVIQLSGPLYIQGVYKNTLTPVIPISSIIKVYESNNEVVQTKTATVGGAVGGIGTNRILGGVVNKSSTTTQYSINYCSVIIEIDSLEIPIIRLSFNTNGVESYRFYKTISLLIEKNK